MFRNLSNPGMLAWLITSVVFLAFSVKVGDWGAAFGLLMLVAIIVGLAIDERHHTYASYAMVVVGAAVSVWSVMSSPKEDLHIFVVPAVLLGGFGLVAGVIDFIKYELKGRP